ncbi:MAG TPA: hypothetical protein VKA21_11510, partial [Candidatus Binatia bacterium]|nr:hypothetical protein [Candidatus Binatia bacterium]
MKRLHLLLVLALAAPLATPAHADPVKCHKTVLSTLRKFKKIYLKANVKCLDAQNIGKISGPCPDASANLKIQTTNQKVVEKISAACTMQDLSDLGFGSSCAFEAATQGIEGSCAALPVTTPAEFAECLKCWKAAELAEYLAILYASHAVEFCGGDLGETSPVCSDLDCTTPLPDQRDLGDTGENDCQRSIGKAGIKYLLTREKVLEKCGLAGGTSATCLADAKVQVALQKAEDKKFAGIKKKCGNRDPVSSAPFCCRTGVGNACSAAADRNDCEVNLGGNVQEGKVCDAGNCDPVPGGGEVTWWVNCPESETCPGTALSTIEDVIDCVDTAADAIVAELLC